MTDTFLIEIPELFEPRESLFFLNRSDKECLFFIENQRVRRLLSLHNRLVLVEFFFTKNKAIQVKVLNGKVNPEELGLIEIYMVKWLGLKDPLDSFYSMAASDEILNPLAIKYKGLRIIGIPDLFEALSWAIIGQQINLSFAYTIKARFVKKYGKRLHLEKKDYYHFPTPEQVVEIPKEELLAMKFSRQKADYLLGIANNFVRGELVENQFKKMSYEKAKDKLIGFRGIGNWSADYVLMKTMKHPQAFPIQDAGLINALKNQLKLESKPNQNQIAELAKPWKGFEALATFYLWRSLM